MNVADPRGSYGDRLQPSTPWWRGSVIYQIYPLSFQDSNNDGRGDLAGILSRLDHLEWLGIDAVWLGPIYLSPMADFGYDISDFENVDPVFGCLAELDQLLDALHGRGIRLLLDFVPNHTSDRHPWFQEARSSRTNPKRNWYIWGDPDSDGGPPNNWLSRFGGSAWKWDASTGQYYYHAFLEEQPDLNWRNADVRQRMADVLRFWLRRGVDGFRIDAAAVLAEDQLLRDDPPNPDVDQNTPPPDHLKRVYTNYRPEVLDWLAELRTVVDEFPDRVLLGEVDGSGDRIFDFHGTKERPIIQLPLNARLLETPWKAPELAEMISSYLERIPEYEWPNWVLGSHDKKRIAAKLGPAQARIAAMLLLSLRGTPIFYAGDELGMAGARQPVEPARDPFEQHVPGYGLNRDPERTPMQWDGRAHAGFTRGTPWLPLAEDYLYCNVETERDDPRSTLHLYRQLLKLRAEEPALSLGDCVEVRAAGTVLTYTRTYESRRISVFLNIAEDPARVPLLPTARGCLLLSTHMDRPRKTASGVIDLRGNEGILVSLTP
jgi:alpha-glucosidase